MIIKYITPTRLGGLNKRVIKIQISINIEIFLFIIIFIITKQIDIYAIFIISTLIHEISHALTGIVLGLKLKQFCIMPFGFKITFEETGTYKKNDIKKLIIASVGPATNLFIMILAIIFNLHSNIIYANLIIAVFNLIPIYPLDGGRILKSILKMKLNHQQINYIVNKTSKITVIILTAAVSILILYIKNIVILFVLAYLWYIVIRENKRYNLIKKVYNIIEEQNVGVASLGDPKN